MLHAFYQLLSYADKLSDPTYVLSATSVAHTFCRNHADCNQNPAIQEIVGYLEDSIIKRLDSNLTIRANREKACTMMNMSILLIM